MLSQGTFHIIIYGACGGYKTVLKHISSLQHLLLDHLSDSLHFLSAGIPGIMIAAILHAFPGRIDQSFSNNVAIGIQPHVFRLILLLKKIIQLDHFLVGIRAPGKDRRSYAFHIKCQVRVCLDPFIIDPDDP